MFIKRYNRLHSEKRNNILKPSKNTMSIKIALKKEFDKSTQ